jgi:hypothetical protein
MMSGCSSIGVSAGFIISEYQMRVLLLGVLLTLGACNDHKRPNSFDAKPRENNATPYNGVPEGEQKK